jgi:hypothetical protein
VWKSSTTKCHQNRTINVENKSKKFNCAHKKKHLGRCVDLHEPYTCSTQTVWSRTEGRGLHIRRSSFTSSRTPNTDSWEVTSSSAGQTNSLHFMEPRGSLTHPQQPASSPYSEPDKSNACPPTLHVVGRTASAKRQPTRAQIRRDRGEPETTTRCNANSSRICEKNILLLLLLAFTTHLRVLASSFLRFRDHTQ